MVDKDVVMAYMNIKSMTFEHMDGTYDYDELAAIADEDPSGSDHSKDALQSSESESGSGPQRPHRLVRLSSRYSLHDLHALSKARLGFLLHNGQKGAQTQISTREKLADPSAGSAAGGGWRSQSVSESANKCEEVDEAKRVSFESKSPVDNSRSRARTSADGSRSGNMSADDERDGSTTTLSA